MVTRVAIFREKYYITEHGAGGNFWLILPEFRLFRGTENARNSVPSKRETPGISFRTIKRKKNFRKLVLFKDKEIPLDDF
jgi:hypothetical protein